MLSVVAFSLLLVAAYVSYKGITNSGFFDKYCFDVDGILVKKEYIRFVSSGFLHVGWLHFIFNMVALYHFAPALEFSIGIQKTYCIYFASMLGGDLLALFIHRNRGDYRAAGASGAIVGLIFSVIALFPGVHLSLIFLPYSVPSWLFAAIYLTIAFYGIKSQSGNVGHEAHLGGGITGLLVTLLLYPETFYDNTFVIVLILLPASIFLYLIISRPWILLVDNPFKREHEKGYTQEDRYNSNKRREEIELDNLLDKIAASGIDSLSKKERQRLEILSGKKEISQ